MNHKTSNYYFIKDRRLNRDRLFIEIPQQQTTPPRKISDPYNPAELIYLQCHTYKNLGTGKDSWVITIGLGLLVGCNLLLVVLILQSLSQLLVLVLMSMLAILALIAALIGIRAELRRIKYR